MNPLFPRETKFSNFLRHGGNSEFILRLHPPRYERHEQKSEDSLAPIIERFKEDLKAEAKIVAGRIIEAFKKISPQRISNFSFQSEKEINTAVDKFRRAYTTSGLDANAVEGWALEHWIRYFSAKLNQKWQAELGVKLYIWRSQGDKKVRSSHAAYNDRIFSWDNPPEEGHPGHSHNCRCWAEPYEHDYRSFFWNSILGHEGGWSDHQSDPGGKTNFGITLVTWKDWSMRLFGIVATEATLRNITQEQAFKIFEIGYWKASGANKIIDQQLAYMFADFVYNSGQGNAARVLQESVNDLGGSLVVDGKAGNATFQAVNALNTARLYRKLRENRWKFLEALMAEEPEREDFRNGWHNRVFSFQDY